MYSLFVHSFGIKRELRWSDEMLWMHFFSYDEIPPIYQSL